MINIAAKWQVGILQAHLPNQKPEVPPHVERLVEALLAGASMREDGGTPHRRALRALEGQRPIISMTPAFGEGTALLRYGRYVEDTNANLFTAGCAFQSFPVIVGDDIQVVYSYNMPMDLDTRRLLQETLCEVFYLGESESAVTLKLVDEIPQHFERYEPARYGGDKRIRVPKKGRLDLLEATYVRRVGLSLAALNDPKLAHRQMAEFREFNDLVDEVEYRKVTNAYDAGWDLRVSLVRDALPNVDGTNFDQFIADYRSSWMDSLRTEAPELTGHERDGTPTTKPHVGFAPILDVGRPYATGAIQGVGILIPKGIPCELVTEINAAIERTVNVRSSSGARRIPLIDSNTYEDSIGKRGPKLRVPHAMFATSTSWATITPAIPFRFTKTEKERKDPDAALPALYEIFERAGLPRPAWIRWGPMNFLSGVKHVGAIAERPIDYAGKPLPLARHLEFGFSVPVKGPIILGRRAWKGYGICFPTSS
jgi:CRISPR-associated protein Csb2